MPSRMITRVVGWAVAIFYDVERAGPGLEPGPVLVAANHPNALVDPLVIFRTGGRPSRPLAKAPLFEQILIGTVLKGLGGLPVYRKQDDPGQMHLNQGTFDAAIEALTRGEAVQIYPEGYSHSEPSVASLRTGAARIALLSEDRSGWTLGLKIQPVGLTYERKPFFRGRAIASYGRPIPVAEYADVYARNPREAARALTEELRHRLLEVTLNVQTHEDRELVDLAERVWARERGTVTPRERSRLSERLPRMQAFARGYARLRAEDSARAAALQTRVRRYQRLVTVLGVREGDVPREYRPLRVFGYVVKQLAMLGLVAPAALLGIAFWAVPYLLTRVVASAFRPKLDQVATYKLAVGCIAFPFWLALAAGAVFMGFGLRPAGLLVLTAPLLGMAAVAWQARQEVVREDVRVFFRVWRRRDARTRLAELRAELMTTFEEVAADWDVGADDGNLEGRVPS